MNYSSQKRRTPHLLQAIATISLLSLSVRAQAVTGNGPRTGTEDVLKVVVLTSATSGTAGSQLRGDITLAATDNLFASTHRVVSKGRLNIDPDGLPTGTYNVTATVKSGTAPVVLGQFNVAAPGTSGTGSVSPTDRENAAETVVKFGGSGTALPAGLDLFDVTGVVISDTNSHPMLTANLATPSNSITFALHVESAIASGTAAPRAQGHLTMLARDHKHWPGIHTFELFAKNLPANISASLAVNGVDVGIVQTGKNGRLLIVRHAGVAHRKGIPYVNVLPPTVGLFDINTLSVHYPGGVELFRIDL